jgi:hypothetical protein
MLHRYYTLVQLLLRLSFVFFLEMQAFHFIIQLTLTIFLFIILFILIIIHIFLIKKIIISKNTFIAQKLPFIALTDLKIYLHRSMDKASKFLRINRH